MDTPEERKTVEQRAKKHMPDEENTMAQMVVEARRRSYIVGFTDRDTEVEQLKQEIEQRKKESDFLNERINNYYQENEKLKARVVEVQQNWGREVEALKSNGIAASNMIKKSQDEITRLREGLRAISEYESQGWEDQTDMYYAIKEMAKQLLSPS